MAVQGMSALLFLIFCCSPWGASSLRARAGMRVSVNPIRRVVTMLQKMTKKVTEEGEIDEELFNKFLCYCTTGAGDLQKSIDAAEEKIPQLEASVTEAQQAITQLEADLKKHTADRAEATESLATAKAIREKDAAAFKKESAESLANIDGLAKAEAALNKGIGGFLQTSAAATLRRIIVDDDDNLSTTDREMLSSFLSEDQSNSDGYAPAAGEIVGIISQLKETMEKELKEMIATEDQAVADYEALSSAKEKQITANTKAVETKTKRHGEVGVELVNLKEDLEDTSKSFAEDKTFLAGLGKSCEKKKADYEVVKKTRSDELVALSETIKIVNDDDALDLFKKTLPSPSLLQTMVSSREVKKRALEALHAANEDKRINLIMLTIRSKNGGFEKVVGMIDKMVALLKEEQVADEDKKKYCLKSIDEAEDDKKALDLEISDAEKSIEDMKSTISTLSEDLAALAQGIKELDAQVTTATLNRKAEHEEYSSTLASDTSAKEILEFAKNRLNKFYNPKLYKAPAEETSALVQDGIAPDAAPKAFNNFEKKDEDNNGVIAMMDMLMADLDKEMQEMEVNEKDAQQEYEEFMADASAKRALDSKSIMEKEGAKADLEAELEKGVVEHKNKHKESYALAVYTRDLHKDCDWLLANFDTRKEARNGEIEALENAKAVLSGADYA